MLRRKMMMACLGAGLMGLSACSTLHKGGDGCSEEACGSKIACNAECTLEAMARDLDHIEGHIDKWGSITTKHPDLWGAARLTKYQQEVEGIFSAEATFKNVDERVSTFQGGRAIADQAFLGSALALNFAISGGAAYITPPSPIIMDTVVTDEKTGAQKIVPKAVSRNKEDKLEAPTSEKGAGLPADMAPGEEAKDGSQTKIVTRHGVLLPGTGGFGKDLPVNVLEPSIILDQKKRFLDHLNAIRRTNEGDDTADSPGYSLYLMRVPVSVLPGKATDVGHGAEIMMSVKPILGDDLLPSTFRNLVINDMVDQYGELLVTLLNEDRGRLYRDFMTQRAAKNALKIAGWGNSSNYCYAAREELSRMNIQVVSENDVVTAMHGLVAAKFEQDNRKYEVVLSVIEQRHEDKRKSIEAAIHDFSSSTGKCFDCDRVGKVVEAAERTSPSYRPSQAAPALTPGEFDEAFPDYKARSKEIIEAAAGRRAHSTDAVNAGPITAPRKAATSEYRSPLVAGARNLSKQSRTRYVAARPSRHAEFAFPMDHVDELFGQTYLEAMIYGVCLRYESELRENKVVHLHEVRSHVREQVMAAYKFLATARPEGWDSCTQRLAVAIRDLNGRRDGTEHRLVSQLRCDFDIRLDRANEDIFGDRLFMKSVAWGVLLESALLNDLLIRDIGETMTGKGLPKPQMEDWPDFYHYDPKSETRRIFNEYVTVRWPMYTFAVDPVTEQQNIADSVSQRREMQLALALAFTSGQINGQSFTRFARRLEADYQTIDLNRTIVGFSHGDNTFGWRFYPRFQTPQIPSNLQVATRDLLGGRTFNKDQELRERRLEPGQRECVAMVIMPSFVPYAEVNISGNWFNLTNPKHKSFTTHDTVKLSKMVRSIEVCSPDHKHIDNYRGGEYGRLQAKAQMLSARLPLQDMKFQVPYENTLGGFQFFNNGITDLVPVLNGWYGAAGFNGTTTTLFLMGDNFSVNNTRLVVGGVSIPHMQVGAQVSESASAVATQSKQPEDGYSFELLSRQVIRVTIPANAAITTETNMRHSETGKYIDIRLATPYGVGGPLRIPVLPGPPASPPAAKPTLTSYLPPDAIATDRATDVFVQGDNLTKEMRVIAGGTTAAFDFIDAKSAKITVPKDVKPSNDPSGNPYVPVTVATAAGVGSTLNLKVIPPPKEKPKAEEFTKGFKLETTKIHINVIRTAEPNGTVTFSVPPRGAVNEPAVLMTYKESPDGYTPREVRATFGFQVGGAGGVSIKVPLKGALASYENAARKFVIDNKELQVLAFELIHRATEIGDEASILKLLDKGALTKTVYIRVDEEPRSMVQLSSNDVLNALEIEFNITQGPILKEPKKIAPAPAKVGAAIQEAQLVLPDITLPVIKD